MNYEAWAVRAIGGGSTDITVGEMPSMPIIPRVGIKGGGPRSERGELWIVECVEQPELKALIGAGFHPPERMNEVAFTPESGLPMSLTTEDRGGGPAATLRALEMLKIKPEEIKVVVIQHMHWDFVYFCEYLPNAQVIIQKREILAAIDPTPECRFGAPKDGTNIVLKRKQPEHLLIIDGDYELWPGFQIIATPGHTDGHQEVIIQTVKGKASLGTENGSNLRNWFPDDPRVFDMVGVEPGPYTFMQGGYLAAQHCCGDPVEFGQSMEKTKRFLPGLKEGKDILVPMMSRGGQPKAVPYQWWTFPSEEWNKELTEMQSKDEYWDPKKLGKQGLFPEVYPFLEIRKEKLKRMGKRTGKN